MGAQSKRAKKVVAASDFDLVQIAAELRAPTVSSGLYSWDLEAVRRAREAQAAGKFAISARLAKATWTDYAIFAAFLNRLAPQRGLPVEMQAPNDTARAIRVREESDALFGPKGIGIHPDTLSDIDGTLANHGIAFGANTVTPRDDGSRVDFELKSWPIEFVRWYPFERQYRTQVQGLGEVPIVHGDGRWVIFQEHQDKPFEHGAIMPAALLWADHAFGVRDRSKASTAHGNAKFVGTMPQDVPLQDSEGKLTKEARAFIELLRIIASADMPVGLKPYGSVVDLIVNNSTAWQIFKEIIDSGDKAADRIYLGTPITAPSSGGDAVGFLFGVRNDIIEGSLGAIERGIKTGVIDPWCAINFGDSSLAPWRKYLLPDADEDARRKSLADRQTAFFNTIDAARKGQFEITQQYVDDLAKQFGVTAPKIKAGIPTGNVGGPQSAPTPSGSPGSASPSPSEAPKLLRSLP